VERFFNIRGLGSCIIGAVGSRATTTLMGCMTIVALIMCVLSVAADLLFVMIDPSLRKSLTFGSTLRRRGER
ncbi:MAG: hypothetical protein II166_01975, partial [Firmicutes bacterium]|nr:hypothetical protein [Bacillota bacterium]